MFSVTQNAVPDDSLLRTYRGGARPDCWRGRGDCFAVSVDRVVSLAEFVFAFCDRYERTRSWFGVVPLSDGSTLLQFGSAVASMKGPRTPTTARGTLFRLLLKFHVVYSQVLLHAAKRVAMRNWKGV